MPVEIGDLAPDFTLKDQHNQDVTLSDFRGRQNVVLLFYPFAFSRVCGSELHQLQENLDKFQNSDVQVLTVSVDTAYAHRVWSDMEGFEFPMLSDFWPHGEVARSYGCFDERRGCAIRGTYVIDREGIVRWKVEKAIPDPRDTASYVDALSPLVEA